MHLISNVEAYPGDAENEYVVYSTFVNYRSRVEHDGRRKTRPEAGVASLARDEDTDISATPAPRMRVLPWVIAAVAGAVAIAAVVGALFVAGVL